jgi:hypothetical protein
MRLGLLLLLLSALAGCASPEPAATPVPPAATDIALKLTGKVDKEIVWTEEEVKAMPTMEARRPNQQGEVDTYTGVSIAHLLAMAGPQADATRVVYVADNGETVEVVLEDVEQCEKCIVSFRTKGGFSIVMPDFPSEVQVKGVIEIQVK